MHIERKSPRIGQGEWGGGSGTIFPLFMGFASQAVVL